MIKRNKLFYGVIALVLLVGLVFAGCGKGGVKFDTSTPEGVVNAFWDAFTKGDFDSAGQYIANDFQAEWNQSIVEIEQMPMIKEFLMVIMGSMQIETTGHTIDGDTATVSMTITAPDLDTLMEEDEELMGMIFMLAMMSMAGPDGVDKEQEAAFKSTLDDIKKKLDKAPKVTEQETTHLVKENGQWKLDQTFDMDLF